LVGAGSTLESALDAPEFIDNVSVGQAHDQAAYALQIAVASSFKPNFGQMPVFSGKFYCFAACSGSVERDSVLHCNTFLMKSKPAVQRAYSVYSLPKKLQVR